MSAAWHGTDNKSDLGNALIMNWRLIYSAHMTLKPSRLGTKMLIHTCIAEKENNHVYRLLLISLEWFYVEHA